MTIISRLGAQWTGVVLRARSWISERTPRERALLSLMAFAASSAICAQMVVVVGDVRMKAEDTHVRRLIAEAEFKAAEDFVRTTSVEQSARAARLASVGGETIHIARARAQAAVEAAAAVAGFTDASVTLAARPVESGAVEGIALTVEGACDQATLGKFLRTLSETESSFVPTAVEMTNDGASARVRMKIQAYALMTAAAS